MRIAQSLSTLSTLAALVLFTSTAAAETRWVEKTGNDVTVLQAWFGDSLGGHDYSPRRFDLDDCQETLEAHYSPGSATSGPSTRYTKRCNAAVEQAMTLPGFGAASPLANNFDYSYHHMEAPNGTNYAISGSCEIVELRTITRDEALAAPSFQGIGFYVRNGMYGNGNGQFIGKDALHAVGHVTLADGAAATVHRFIAQGMCFGTGGNGGSIASRSTWFKPYARFDAPAANGDQTNYIVWDGVSSDYLLGKAQYPANGFVRTFDRQGELLKP